MVLNHQIGVRFPVPLPIKIPKPNSQDPNPKVAGRLPAAPCVVAVTFGIVSTRSTPSVLARAPGPCVQTARGEKSSGDSPRPKPGESFATNRGALCRGRGTSGLRYEYDESEILGALNTTPGAVLIRRRPVRGWLI